MNNPPRPASASRSRARRKAASEEVIRGRAIELAILSGRSLHQVTESDRDAARRELRENTN